MSTYTHLYWYRCSFCKSEASFPMLVKSTLRCGACRRLLAYQFSEPITTDEQRERAGRGVVFQGAARIDPPPPRHSRCRAKGCYVMTREDLAVYLPGVGHCCTPAHAEQAQREWDDFMERMRQYREERPELWVMPAKKTAS